MPRFDYRELGDDFVVHFGVEHHRVALPTLASTLNSIDGALQIISELAEPGTRLEISVDAIGPGSFRIQLSPRAKEFLSDRATDARNIIIGVLIGLILLKIDDQKSDPHTIVQGDQIINIQKNELIITEEAARILVQARDDDQLDVCISDGFGKLLGDGEVSSFGITRKLDDKEPDVLVQRDDFPAIAKPRQREEDVTQRDLNTKETLLILKAVFEKSNRKWEFVWQGRKISAPILHESFFDKLATHEIVLGTGDSLDVELRRTQEWNEIVNAWVDKSYTVTTVFNHHEGTKQSDLFH